MELVRRVREYCLKCKRQSPKGVEECTNSACVFHALRFFEVCEAEPERKQKTWQYVDTSTKEELKISKPEACHRYQSCSVNNCPLAEEKYFAEESDDEIKCPLTEYDIEKIKERYNRIKNNPVIVPEPDPILFSENMRDEHGNLFRMNAEQTRKVHTLVKNECCNFDKGKCKYLCDDDLKCPQLLTSTVVCAWCREAIIPLAPDLEREIFHTKEKGNTKPKKTMKICDVCGRRFKPKTARTKYCPKCAVRVRRKQWAQSQRKIRSKSTI
jgi:hypothetical protein